MKIVIASDSYKESLTSLEVAQEIKKAFKTVFKNAKYEIVCLADGGEGTVDALVKSCQGKYKKVKVFNPLMKKISSYYGVIDEGQTAVIEMGNCVGLQLFKPQEKDVFKATSFGFGQMIEKARKAGFEKVILGLGGSATNDAGIGMLQAMGVKFLNKKKEVFNATVENMHEIAFLDDKSFQKKYASMQFEIACDVQNPLCGKEGASYVFGKQKGASTSQLAFLDKQLMHFAKICKVHFKRSEKNCAGAGAAGGVGFALKTFLNVSMRSGISIVMEKSKLESKIEDANLVITGEGRVDSQTAYGKTIVGVSSLAKKYNVPVIVIAGCTQKGYETIYEKGVDAIFDITPMNDPLDKLLKKSQENLYNTAKNIAIVLNLSKKIIKK